MSKYIAHYGVKGMKWRKKNAVEVYNVAPGVVNRAVIGKRSTPVMVGLGAANYPKDDDTKPRLKTRINGDREKASSRNFESYRRYKKDTIFKKKINAKKEYIKSLKNKRKNNLITRAAYRTKMTKAIYDIKNITNAMNSINKKKPTRKVSREYLEELEYNSRRNNF